MEATYYMRVYIESMGTELTTGDTTKSKAGHMWYEIYQKDSEGNIIENSQKSAGYTPSGLIDVDRELYKGDPAYSSKEVELTQEKYKTLKDFGDKGSNSAKEYGFGNNDYNPATNSCVDFTYKALEVADINKDSFEGDVIPMNNRDNLDKMLGLGNYEPMNNRDNLDKMLGLGNYEPTRYEAWEELSKEEQAEWIKSGGTPWNYDQAEADKKALEKELKNNNQTSNQLLPKEAILLADSGQIKSDVFFNYVEEEKPEKISARLIFLENDIKNQTYGVIDGSYNISHIRGESGINNPYSYYVDFISDEKIVLSDILNIDAKIKLKERFI